MFDLVAIPEAINLRITEVTSQTIQVTFGSSNSSLVNKLDNYNVSKDEIEMR